MSLSEETLSLQRAAHDLMYLGMDGSPVYSDDLSRRNGEIYRMTTALYNSGFKGSTVEEQANVCLALLMGYNASFIDHGEKQEHIQEILNRCWDHSFQCICIVLQRTGAGVYVGSYLQFH